MIWANEKLHMSQYKAQEVAKVDVNNQGNTLIEQNNKDKVKFKHIPEQQHEQVENDANNV